MIDSDVQRSRAAQVGFLMRSYRQSFSQGEGRRGLTQKALLERMASVDGEYAERYSHATVSRWESGGTRPTLQRLKVFGTALNLSQPEVAGLILLAGLAPDFQTATEHLTLRSSAVGAISNDGTAGGISARVVGENERAWATESASSILRDVIRFGLLRFLLLGICIVGGGYGLSLFGWNDVWMPIVYVACITGLVLAQGFLLPDHDADLREFFWISLFFLLTTPLLQFAPIRMDHYNFHTIESFAGTQMPYLLALLVNLLVSSAAGLMFHLLWKRQYACVRGRSNALRRATWVALPPVVFVYAVIVVITNISVSIQLAVLLPVLAAVFTMLLVLRDPSVNTSDRNRRFLLSTTMAVALVSTTLGIITILSIYVSPDLPVVLPDHNLLRSWEINFAELGYTQGEALDRVNLGYMWHAMCVFVYMVFVVGGNLIVTIYQMDDDQRQLGTLGLPQPNFKVMA